MLKILAWMTLFGLIVGTIPIAAFTRTGQAGGHVINEFFESLNNTAEEIDRGQAPWNQTGQ